MTKEQMIAIKLSYWKKAEERSRQFAAERGNDAIVPDYGMTRTHIIERLQAAERMAAE